MAADERRREPAPDSGIWKAVVESTSDLVILTDASGTPFYLNPAVYEVLGFEKGPAPIPDPLSIIHPKDRDAMRDRIPSVRAQGRTGGPALMRARHRDGSWRWLEVVASDRLGDPEVGALIVTARDVTARVEAEHALAAETERYRVLVETIPSTVVRFDTEMNVQYLNPAAEALVDRMGEIDLSQRWAIDSVDNAAQAFERAMRTRQTVTYEHPIMFDGMTRWYEVAAVPEVGPDDKVESVTAIAHDITERKEAEEHLALTVFEDSLTGLVNRAGFELAVEEALHDSGRPHGLLYLDLDNFKLVNDHRGHAAGDAFLIEVGEHLQAAVRPGDLVARLGGDEFVVYPARIRVIEDMWALADRLHEELAGMAYLDSGHRVGTISIGFAFLESGGCNDLSLLLGRADSAMYQAKRKGRGCTVAGH